MIGHKNFFTTLLKGSTSAHSNNLFKYQVLVGFGREIEEYVGEVGNIFDRNMPV